MHGLYTPRDFDTSPFFQIVKPTLAAGFDYRSVQWEPPGFSDNAEIDPGNLPAQ
jgi:hypothetical protein